MTTALEAKVYVTEALWDSFCFGTIEMPKHLGVYFTFNYIEK